MKYFQVFLLFVILYFSSSNIFAQNRNELQIIKDKIDSLVSYGNELRNSEPEQALLLCNRALSLADSIDYTFGKIKALDQIGVQYKKYGVFDESLRNHFQALELLPYNDSSMTKAFILSNIANTYTNLKNFKEGEINYLRSLKIKRKLNDKKQIAYTLSKLGLLSVELGEYEKAIKYSLQALEIVKENNDSLQISNTLAYLGFIEYRKGNYNKSIDYLKRSKPIKNKFPGEIYGMVELEIWTALNNIQLKKYTIALKYLASAKKRATKISSKKQLLQIYYTLSEVHNLLNHTQLAYNYLIKADLLNKEINSEVTLKKIAQLSIVYGVAKKERENQFLKEENLLNQLEIEQQSNIKNVLIIVLISAVIIIVLMLNSAKVKKRKNIEIEKQKNNLEKLNKQLEDANATKDKFFAIIAHDMRAPFSTLIGFSQMMGEDFDEMTDEDKREFIKTIESISKNSHELLDNLLSWSSSQLGNMQINKTEVSVNEMILNNIKMLDGIAQKKNISLSSNISDELKINVDLNMLNTVIRNLLTNSIKFTEIGGHVKVTANKEDSKISISIIDNGVGMNEITQKSLFKIDKKIINEGTAKEKGTGLGLLLCKEFVEKNDGNIRVNSKLGEGSEFIIEFDSF